MIALEVAEGILGMFPSSLVGTNCAQTAVEPLVLIGAKKDAVYLAGTTTMVVGCLAARHLPHEGLLGDTLDEDCGYSSMAAGSPPAAAHRAWTCMMFASNVTAG
jgi:hypothetical protein